MSGSKILAVLMTVAVTSPATPMIVAKPHGTFAIHKEAGKENAGAPSAKAGLTIPPQLVVPLVSRSK
jgi:hypothetical protein